MARRRIHVKAHEPQIFHYHEQETQRHSHRVKARRNWFIGWRVKLAQGGDFQPFTITFEGESPFSWTTKSFPASNSFQGDRTGGPDQKDYKYTLRVDSNGWEDDPFIQIDDGTDPAEKTEKKTIVGAILIGSGLALLGFGIASQLRAGDEPDELPPSE
jgi:hypothetical protein